MFMFQVTKKSFLVLVFINDNNPDHKITINMTRKSIHVARKKYVFTFIGQYF